MAGANGVNLDLSMGVIFVGLAITGCLFGVTTLQTGWYFKHYPNDRSLLKLLVVTIWALDATHLGLYTATIFIYLVKKNALYFGAEPLPWTANMQLLCNACASGLIQSFYASRLWTLSRRVVLLTAMSFFIAATWVFSIILFVKTILTHTVAEFIHLAPYDIAMSSLSASTDVLLCGALVWLLSRSRTGTQNADRLINKLLFYTLNTGLLTSLCAVLAVVMVVIMPQTSFFVMFYYIGSRLYSVSLLATLNARLGLRIQAERLGERTLPEIEITAQQRITNKASLQINALRRRDTSASTPDMNTITTVTTGEKSLGIATPATIVCDGGRCYAMPELEFCFSPDFGDMTPCSVPEPSDLQV